MTYRGRHFSPSLSGDRYLKLGSKSDHRTEISWNIVQYDALVPRPEGLRCLYFVFECAVGKKNMQIKSAKHRELLLVLVSFFGHEKGGIYNGSEFIISTDKPNLRVLNQHMRLEYEPMECYVILVHLQYELYC